MRTAILAMATLAVPVAAETAPPAEPPWTCAVMAACDAGGCVPSGERGTMLVEPGPAPRQVVVEGEPAALFATRAEADAAIVADALPPETSMILVRDAQDPADAIGLSAFGPPAEADPRSADRYVSLICTGP